MTFFTSDSHFFHANIIKYANRPFSQPSDFDYNGEWRNRQIANARAREMDEALINNWNSKITDKDIVYHLGDFCFGTAGDAVEYLKRLNFAKFYFVWGNHDRAMEELSKRIPLNLKNHLFFIGDMPEVRVDGQKIVLTHYAMRVWNKSHHGTWSLWGHSHGTLPDDPNSLSMDVGVDTNNYFPYSFEEIKARMACKTFVPVDHHTGER